MKAFLIVFLLGSSAVWMGWQPSERMNVRGVLRDVGLTSQVLALSGLTTNDMDAIASALEGSTESVAAVAAAEQQLVSARTLERSAIAAFNANPTSEDLRDAATDARRARREADSQLRASQQQLRGMALAVCNESKRTAALAVLSSAQFTVPNEFRVVPLTSSEWRAIQSGIAAERHAATEGREAPDRSAGVRTLRTDLRVISAGQDLDARTRALDAWEPRR